MSVHEFRKKPRVVPVPGTDSLACPRCGESIDAYAQRCRACGVNFAGPAYQVAHRSDGPAQRSRFLTWSIVVLVSMMVAGFVIALLAAARG